MENQKEYGWDDSSSIHQIEFKQRPMLEDMSIVIPTLGRKILEQSLFWILMGSAWPRDLIIVEQGSNMEVNAWLDRVRSMGIQVKHIRSGQRGRSAGVNRGLEQVTTSFVAITDDDCFVEAEWLMNIANRLRLMPDAVVTGRVEAAGEDMTVVVTSTVPAVQRRPRLKFDSMSGGNMATSISVVKKVGLFDEDACMQTAEDAEWSYRALRRGVTIFYEPDICVQHFGWRDLAKRDTQYRHYALSHGGFYGKYLRRGDLFILLRAGAHYLRAFRRWITGKRTGDTDSALIGRAYCLGLLPGMLAGLRSKARAGELA